MVDSLSDAKMKDTLDNEPCGVCNRMKDEARSPSSTPTPWN